MMTIDPESQRLAEDEARQRNWKRWGPYLAQRQWGTVREDYSADGSCWTYFPHDHARSRVYRWGEDGLLGLTDRECRLCFAPSLWNGKDPILKERLFGLTGPEGNHGEDVKESYFYVDATPTSSYLKAIYKYPQAEFPYSGLVEENRRRGKSDPEFEITDTGVFADGKYFDVTVEYAKQSPEDLLIRLTVANRGPETATVYLLPTLWCRNTWIWGRTGERYWPKPRISSLGPQALLVDHASLGRYRLEVGSGPQATLFTENETNIQRLYGSPNANPYVKDAFHAWLIEGRHDAVNPANEGTKAAWVYRFDLPPGGESVLQVRLCAESEPDLGFGASFDAVVAQRIAEADSFYASRQRSAMTDDERDVHRQASAGLLWSRQYYGYIVEQWMEGDPGQPAPPAGHARSRNVGWQHVYSTDVLSMPDNWEYPWFASWDLAFHMLCFAKIDPQFAKEQLILLLREWYMHPNGQIPAYEFAFGDVNPPVHAWACWRVYKMTAAKGARDRLFLERTFQKLLINFTWWVNRKDLEGNNLFAGGFLGLDNIGVFDRSRPLPTGGHLQQADGTAWMAFFCTSMLSMALELARKDPAYEDLASKFFEHFVAITDAINSLGGSGLWDEDDGFYYDQLAVDGASFPLRIRSAVGIIPLFAVTTLSESLLKRLPDFSKRMRWFVDNRKDLARHITFLDKTAHSDADAERLLAIPSRDRLIRVLRYVLDENEFLSPYGVRSVSRVHAEHPYVLDAGGQRYTVSYTPGESDTGLFGGNSNWRGPVWFPLNFLLIEALEKYHHFYRDSLKVECPTGSGHMMNLDEVAGELRRRLASIFLRDGSGHRACHGGNPLFADDPHWRNLVLFYEYFHGDRGWGLGASHQTGWTALVSLILNDLAKTRAATSSAAHAQSPLASSP
jgi:hypothetical protein